MDDHKNEISSNIEKNPGLMKYTLDYKRNYEATKLCRLHHY